LALSRGTTARTCPKRCADMPEENLVKSARNLAGIKPIPAHILSVADMLSCKMLLMTESAVRRAESLWGGGHASV